MNKALVMIDMQEGFDASNKIAVQIECQKLIKYAISKNMPVIVLEYAGQRWYGRTHDCLTSLYQNYSKYKLLKKRDDSGAIQVHNYLKKNYKNLSDIIVCGVNIDACVLETVAGLSLRGYNVNVVKKACNTDNYYRSWSHFRGMANTKIVQEII